VADSKVRARAAAPPRSPVATVLASCRGAFIGIGLVSGIINVLMLTSSLFMMQVYDRVLGSQSVPTLVALSLIAVAAYLFQGWLDILRTRVLALIGERVDAEIGPKVHAAVVDLPLRTSSTNQEALQPFRQLEALRGFLAGAGPVALFDMPWMPIYLAVCFLLHPWLGWVTLGGAVVLVVLTLLTEVKSKGPSRAAMEAQSVRNAVADAAQRGAEVVRAMGMFPALAARWEKAHEAHLLAQRRANYVVGGLSATAKMLRFILQSALLGIGGYLAIRGEILGRHDHRGLDPGLARPCACRPGDRKLEGLRGRPPRLPAAQDAARPLSQSTEAVRAARTVQDSDRREPCSRRPWRPEADRAAPLPQA
jgi:ATP-binding cassette subfamily C protein